MSPTDPELSLPGRWVVLHCADLYWAVCSGLAHTGEILARLVQQTVLLLKQNKHFSRLSAGDQAELCQANILPCILLCLAPLYSPTPTQR